MFARDCCAALVVLVFSLPAAAGAHKSDDWARTQFAAAEHLHEALEARPAQELTRADYDRVINAYRRIYFEAPASSKADPSVVAVAQLLEEMGRRFEDRAILRSAIREYEFLRRQYPGSKARFGALFRIGEIYKDDLHDKPHADEVFQEFLRRYPRNQFADEARKALAEPLEKVATASDAKAGVGTQSRRSDLDREQSDDEAEKAETIDKPAKGDASGSESGKLARITKVRYWSTPDATHVTIDLQREVKFDSQRLDHPDRIFFDLFDTRLDSAELGKTLNLDENLVKKIRISQYKPRQARVVLELAEPAGFQASFLANPPRLVIDVPNKQVAKVKATEIGGGNAREPDTAASPPTEMQTTGDAATDPALSKEPETREASTALGKPASASVPVDEHRPNKVTTTTSNGVRKTIVEPDDGDDAPGASLAKVEAPDVKTATPPAPTKEKKSQGKRKASPDKADESADAREAQPTEAGDRSLIRALGLKIGKIVIDPGHGGHDTGTIGPGGLEEKDVVLDVSKRLGKLLASRLGAQVVYTRSDDTFIPLETRTAIANQEAADLFVSVHANSSRDPDARGVETYYLNFTSSPDALEVAARENAVSEESIHQLQDLVKKIALKEKIDESREFAVDVDRSLHGGLAARSAGIRDRGVKKAPFIVLIGANMPSILAEISFLSNPGDERRLKTSEYRQRIAESLYRGIAKYVNGLSGVKVASKIEKSE
jgi:N-acetylmuramoyl-L-alanine amidase